ncbi:MAG TPA: CapA family protein, partial [Anaerolineales bacterium]|nr:CapA family protein [Anaerolineales bacterium]
TRTPFRPLPPSPTFTLTPTLQFTLTPTQPAQIPLWLDAALPPEFIAGVTVPAAFRIAPDADAGLLRLAPGGERPVAAWVYALAAPFPTLETGVSAAELLRAWRGEAVGAFSARRLLLSADTHGMLAAVWGAPGPGPVEVLAAEQLLETAWQRGDWAILPFERLEPRWTVLEVDGRSPLRKDFDPMGYALTLPISLAGDPELAAWALASYGAVDGLVFVPGTNRDPQRLTVLAMTGVTALVRATAFTMERRGLDYPAGDVGPLLQAADLTHISNEVAFARDCPPPDPVQQGLRFCSDPRYIGLMEAVGTDIVELTGDHLQDWGAEALQYTLDLYAERGWLTYGGGANLAQARQALLVEHNGNRLAFIGCNAKGGGFAQAGPNRPGAAACDLDVMQAEIARLRSLGILPIATFQHFEYYTYRAQADQQRDFRRMAEAGAVIVSGSQAHQPQAFEFSGASLIHYGLGNLFFDQFEVSPATRQGFIDRHIFYNGQYIGVELIPIVFVDYARPRLMDAAEREELLHSVFNASGW